MTQLIDQDACREHRFERSEECFDCVYAKGMRMGIEYRCAEVAQEVTGERFPVLLMEFREP